MIQSNATPIADPRFDQADDDGFRSALPMHGATNPSSEQAGTTPGSFANAADVGGPLTFSSPDTPGMPLPSSQTAWGRLRIKQRK